MTQQKNSSPFQFLALLTIFVLFAALLYTRFGMKSDIGGLSAGEPLPPIEAAGWLNGAPPAEDELRGNVVVVVAYAHWCPPCREEAPKLVKMHQEFSQMGVQFIGLTSDESSDLEHTKAFLQEYEIAWPNGYGAEDTLSKLQVEYIPAIWVVGKDGTITWNMDDEYRLSLKEAIVQALNN